MAKAKGVNPRLPLSLALRSRPLTKCSLVALRSPSAVALQIKLAGGLKPSNSSDGRSGLFVSSATDVLEGENRDRCTVLRGISWAAASNGELTSSSANANQISFLSVEYS